MNLIRRYLFAPFLIFFLILSACEKPPHLREGIADGDFILSFEIEGLNASETIEPILKPADHPTRSARAQQLIFDKDNSREKREIVARKITEFKGLEARLLLEEIPLDRPLKEDSRSSIQTKGSKASIEKRALSNMSPNKRYRVLIFNTNTAGEATTYVNQSQGVVGSPLKIPVYRNKTYRWFAYSYNREEDIPAINSIGYNVPVTANLNSSENDFLYSTGLIKTSGVVNDENPISITFSRQLARI